MLCSLTFQMAEFHMRDYSSTSNCRPDWKVYACNVALHLFPSASCSLKHTVSAPARKPLRIFRYMLSVSMNYFIAGSTSH